MYHQHALTKNLLRGMAAYGEIRRVVDNYEIPVLQTAESIPAFSFAQLK